VLEWASLSYIVEDCFCFPPQIFTESDKQPGMDGGIGVCKPKEQQSES